MKQINVPLNVKKVIVAKNKYDLFTRGFYTIEKNDNDKFDRVDIPQSVFINECNKWFDTHYFDKKFNCGYKGGGPYDFINFLREHTNENEEEIEEIVHKAENRVVEYDFQEQKFILHQSFFNDSTSTFHITAKKDGQLVFILGKHHFFANPPLYDREEIAREIIDRHHIIKQLIGEEPLLRRIHYIGDVQSDEYFYHRHGNQTFNFILHYDGFEVWANVPFSKDQKNIQYDTSFQDFLKLLGLELKDPQLQNRVLKWLDKGLYHGSQNNQSLTIN